MDGEDLAPGRESSPGGDAAAGAPPAAPGGGRFSPGAPGPAPAPDLIPAPDAPAGGPYVEGTGAEGERASAPGTAQGPVPVPGPAEAAAAPVEAVPAAVWPSRAGVAPTGDERVDEMLARLGEVPGRPVGEHVAVYDDLHHGLQEVLASTGQDESGGEGADHGAGRRTGPRDGQGGQGGQAGRGPVPGAPWRGPRPLGSR